MIDHNRVEFFANHSDKLVSLDGDRVIFHAFGMLETISDVIEIYLFLITRKQGDEDHPLFIQSKLRWAARFALESSSEDIEKTSEKTHLVWKEALHDSEHIAWALFMHTILIERANERSNDESIDKTNRAIAPDHTSAPCHKTSFTNHLELKAKGVVQIEYTENDSELKFSLTSTEGSDIQIIINQPSPKGIHVV